jgi:hypothetical protein
MAYDAFEPRVLPLLFFYFGLIIFSTFLTVEMFAKWRERKARPAGLMAAVFALFTAALVMLAIGLADSAISGFYRETYRFSLPFGYSMIVIADIILFLFASEITSHWKKGLVPVIIAGAALAVVLYLPWNWWGYPNAEYAGLLNIRLYSTLGLIAFSYTIYIMIAWVCRHVMAEAKSPVAKAGLQLMFFAMIIMILYFAMFNIDTVLIIAFDYPGYSVFVYIAWVFGMLFYICMYLSVAMPAWFEKRISNKA